MSCTVFHALCYHPAHHATASVPSPIPFQSCSPPLPTLITHNRNTFRGLSIATRHTQLDWDRGKQVCKNAVAQWRALLGRDTEHQKVGAAHAVLHLCLCGLVGNCTQLNGHHWNTITPGHHLRRNSAGPAWVQYCDLCSAVQGSVDNKDRVIRCFFKLPCLLFENCVVFLLSLCCSNRDACSAVLSAECVS